MYKRVWIISFLLFFTAAIMCAQCADADDPLGNFSLLVNNDRGLTDSEKRVWINLSEKQIALV